MSILADSRRMSNNKINKNVVIKTLSLFVYLFQLQIQTSQSISTVKAITTVSDENLAPPTIKTSTIVDSINSTKPARQSDQSATSGKNLKFVRQHLLSKRNDFLQAHLDASQAANRKLLSEVIPSASSPSQSPPPAPPAPVHQTQAMIERTAFVREFLQMMYEQYGAKQTPITTSLDTSGSNKIEDRQSTSVSLGTPAMGQLLEAIGSNGDVRRLIDWISSAFNPAWMSEVLTQFVVGKLASVNCPALLRPDSEEGLVPRFLLFNEHYEDVPFELNIGPTQKECLTDAKFDPTRKTIILVHGYLTGYTLVDGITNIKNRILDLNKITNSKAMEMFRRISEANNGSGKGGSDYLTLDQNDNILNANSTTQRTNYVFAEDPSAKIRSQLYNVIIVDWFNGANPSPRANYIRAAVNAQVVGNLIAKFLSNLVVQCKTPASNLQIIAHSLGKL